MRMFFILGLGRSGTAFLSSLLSRDRRGVVHHEPNPQDAGLLVLRHAGVFNHTVDQLLGERFRVLLSRADGAEFYGEVNSLLRYEADWLRARFDPTLIHLVRDGRDFVRSAYIRDVFTEYEADGPILPHDGDPFAARWSKMSRFERLCWYWMHTNDVLASQVERRARFEDLLADYRSFEREILQPIGVRVSEDLWSREVRRPRNTSRHFVLKRVARRLVGRRRQRPAATPLPHWSEWDEAQTQRFWEICGPTMQQMGYRR